jgi:hypothetical protein
MSQDLHFFPCMRSYYREETVFAGNFVELTRLYGPQNGSQF